MKNASKKRAKFIKNPEKLPPKIDAEKRCENEVPAVVQAIGSIAFDPALAVLGGPLLVQYPPIVQDNI